MLSLDTLEAFFGFLAPSAQARSNQKKITARADGTSPRGGSRYINPEETPRGFLFQLEEVKEV